MRQKLTVAFVMDPPKPSKGRIVYWDTAQPGFGLRVTSTGHKSYVVQSGNPAGRPRKHIADMSKEARRYAHLALSTLVKICKDGAERNRLAAASALLDRGYGRPVTAIDLITAGKKLSELSQEELEAFEARLMTSAADDEPAQGEMFH
jgi:hypothetical protein